MEGTTALHMLAVRESGDGQMTLVLSLARVIAQEVLTLLGGKDIQKIVGRHNLNFSMGAFIPPVPGRIWGFHQACYCSQRLNGCVELHFPLRQIFNSERGVEMSGWELAVTWSIVCNAVTHVAEGRYADTERPPFHLLSVVCPDIRDCNGGCSMDVVVAPLLAQWFLSDNANDEAFAEMTRLMRRAHEIVYGDTHHSGTYAEKDGALVPVFSAEGDAVCLVFDRDQPCADDLEDTGYTLISENVDNPAQMLVLLIGVASLEQTARKDGF